MSNELPPIIKITTNRQDLPATIKVNGVVFKVGS